HVIDRHDSKRHEHKEEVLSVIHELGAGTIPMLQVNNKLDLLPDLEPSTQYDENGKPIKVQLSSRSGVGIPLLYAALKDLLGNTVK
ncbi:MAG: GTPase HflX, partial [Gammaproteobacteria bacterium]|nr:GTPase HflX [Gammaproteobacteria bacterium]